MLKIHHIIARGEGHKNFCEDFVLLHNTHEQWLLAAVFDGCSGGTDSHLASALMGKIVRQSFEKYMQQHTNAKALLFDVLYETFCQFYNVSQQISLTVSEQLSTINVVVVNKTTLQANFACIGDGFISVNGTNTIIDQQNQPQYMAYAFEHVKNREEFDTWLNEKNLITQTDKLTDISIATDGILSFRYIADHLPTNEFDVVSYLAHDKQLIRNASMLARKCNIMYNQHKLVHIDDLAMVRIANLPD